MKRGGVSVCTSSFSHRVTLLSFFLNLFAKGAGWTRSRRSCSSGVFPHVFREEASDRADSKTLKLSVSISGRYQTLEPSCQGHSALSSSSDGVSF